MCRESFRARGQGAEDGFTLIELMVVVLIIAILIAIAIPAFLGARQRAEDRATQSNLRTALVQAKVIYTDQENYTQADAVALGSLEPNLTFVVATTLSPDHRVVSVDPAASNYIVLASASKSGKCFYLSDEQATIGTKYYSDVPAGGCSASAAPAKNSLLWAQSW